VPVQTRDGVIAAMNVAAPALRVAPAVLVEVVAAKLQAAAAAIGRAQGHP
jgi:DNA-binding IclR family transcriptional regulator